MGVRRAQAAAPGRRVALRLSRAVQGGRLVLRPGRRPAVIAAAAAGRAASGRAQEAWPGRRPLGRAAAARRSGQQKVSRVWGLEQQASAWSLGVQGLAQIEGRALGARSEHAAHRAKSGGAASSSAAARDTRP